MTACRGPYRVVVLAIVGALAAGCSGASVKTTAGSSTRTSAVPSVSASTSATSASSKPIPSGPAAAAVAAYRRFWIALPRASVATTLSKRLAALVSVTTDPELSQLVTRIGAERQQGKQFYGHDRTNVQRVTVRGTRAVVRDC